MKKAMFSPSDLDPLIISAIEEMIGVKLEELCDECDMKKTKITLSSDPEDTKRVLGRAIIKNDEIKERVHFVARKHFVISDIKSVEVIKDTVKPGSVIMGSFYESGVEGTVEGVLTSSLSAIVKEKIDIEDGTFEIEVYMGIDDVIREKNKRRAYYEEVSEVFKGTKKEGI